MKHLTLYLTFIFLLTACRKEPTDKIPISQGVYIVNEGNFNFGNADVSSYDPSKQILTNGLFKSANGFSLGDVAQSMFIRDTLAFIVVNNSQKIEVVRLPSFQKVRTIQLIGSSPRSFLAVNDSVAYVSELYANKVYVLNYQNGTLVKEIAVPQYTEFMLKIGNDVFVQGKKLMSDAGAKGRVFKLDALTHTLVDFKEYNGDVNGLAKDNLNRLWVSVGSNAATSELAVLHCYTTYFSLVKSLSTASAGRSIRFLQTNATGTVLYFCNGDVFKMNVSETTLPTTPLVSGQDKNIYALGVDPKTEDCYLSDALDYIQASRIYRYDNKGDLVHSFTAGIISGQFVFNYE